MFKMSMQVKPVKPRRVSASKLANDNEETLWSHLKWREQAEISKRIDDLQWQVNYATIQLKNWKSLGEGGALIFLLARKHKPRLFRAPVSKRAVLGCGLHIHCKPHSP